MGKYFIFLFFGPFFLLSCQDEQRASNSLEHEVKGDVRYGGIFKFQSPEKVEALFPLLGTTTFTRNITYQIFETLLKTDLSSMRTKSNLAKSFKVNSLGTVYTLTIRNDVYFHPNDCFDTDRRKLTVQDVKYSLELACSDLDINKMSYLLVNKIKGAKSFHNKSKTKLHPKGVSGIKIVDEHTITIELTESFSGFEKILAHSNLTIVAREAIEKYGKDIDKHPVGTGPFVLEEMTDDKITLKRFDNYWRKDQLGNPLPYLAGVELTYFNDKKEELESFRNEKLDCVMHIPVEEINFILGSLQDAQQGENVIHKVLSEPSMSMMYIGYACQSPEFKDQRVRQAFNMVVDRAQVVNSYLSGEGWPAMHGFIPPLDFYPNDDVKSSEYNVEKARELMKAAGFPEGKDFPEIEVYVNAQKNSPNHKMVRGVVDQINANLGTNLKIKLCNISQRNIAIATGKAKMWRAGWIADYAHPENFLSLFYSRNIVSNNSTINSFRYRNTEFDDILDQANKELDESIRNQLFVLCDQMIVDEAVVMPILTEDFIILLNGRVKNFQPNSMEILDFSTIFIKGPKKD